MKLQNHELAFVQLGFRVSQLLEIYDRIHVYLSLTPRIIQRLAATLKEAVEVCPFTLRDTTEILRVVERHSAILQNAEILLESLGTPQFYEELHATSRDLERAVRMALRRDRQSMACFEVGVLLAKSDDDPKLLVTGTSNSPRSWSFRHPEELQTALVSLELNTEQISGLPVQVAEFVVGLSPNDERFSRYTQDRWGWSFIEDRLVNLADGLNFGPQPEGKSQQADGEPESDDELLAEYLDPLTPLQTSVVEVLWTRRHITKFDTLRSTAWKHRRPVSNSGIARLLKRINARWTDLAYSLEISEPKAAVKLIRPDPDADGKV